jgi:transcriptional regulator with XRE-family HTH domain
MADETFVANNLRKCRKDAGLLQREVAQILKMDCADRISHWENGIAMPSVVNLFRLAIIYKVLPHELYPGLYQVLQRSGQED